MVWVLKESLNFSVGYGIRFVHPKIKANSLGKCLPGDSLWPFWDGWVTLLRGFSDLQLGDEKVTLNHLVWFTLQIDLTYMGIKYEKCPTPIYHFTTRMEVSTLIMAIPLYIIEHFTNLIPNMMGLRKRVYQKSLPFWDLLAIFLDLFFPSFHLDGPKII